MIDIANFHKNRSVCLQDRPCSLKHNGWHLTDWLVTKEHCRPNRTILLYTNLYPLKNASTLPKWRKTEPDTNEDPMIDTWIMIVH